MAVESKMIPCPHCGTANSARKRLCFNCQKEINGAEEQPSPAKANPLGALRAALSRPLSQPGAQDIPDAGAKLPPVPASPVGSLRAAVQQHRNMLADFTANPSLHTRRPVLAASALFGATVQQRVQFFRQLHSMLQAGIPLTQSLHFLQGNVSPIFRPVARDIAENVSLGIPLSAVMTRYTNLFPEWEVNIVRAAELSGSLPEVIDEIATTLEEEMRLRSRVRAVMLPMFATVLVAILVVLIVSNLVNLNGNMAALPQRMERAGLTFLAIVLGGIIVWRLWRIITRTRAGSFIINTVITRVPLLGPIMRNMMRIRFARVLAAVWNAGVGPMESVLSAARASGNLAAIYRARYEVPRLGEGAQLVDVLEAVRIFPRDSMHIIRTGEVTGSLPESLRKVAQYYKIDLDSQVDTLPAKVIIWYYILIVPPIVYFIFRFYTGMMRDAMDLTR